MIAGAKASAVETILSESTTSRLPDIVVVEDDNDRGRPRRWGEALTGLIYEATILLCRAYGVRGRNRPSIGKD